jgi:hypothetical protein
MLQRHPAGEFSNFLVETDTPAPRLEVHIVNDSVRQREADIRTFIGRHNGPQAFRMEQIGWPNPDFRQRVWACISREPPEKASRGTARKG